MLICQKTYTGKASIFKNKLCLTIGDVNSEILPLKPVLVRGKMNRKAINSSKLIFATSVDIKKPSGICKFSYAAVGQTKQTKQSPASK